MNPTVHPVFMVVMVNVIVVSRAKVINNATNKPEYLLSNLKIFHNIHLFSYNLLDFSVFKRVIFYCTIKVYP